MRPLTLLLYIHKGGKWVQGASKRHIDVLNPATEEVIARVAAGTSEDVDAAVKAAREAFDKLGYVISFQSFNSKRLLKRMERYIW